MDYKKLFVHCLAGFRPQVALSFFTNALDHRLFGSIKHDALEKQKLKLLPVRTLLGQPSATAMVKPFGRTLLESGRTSQTKKYNLLKPLTSSSCSFCTCAICTAKALCYKKNSILHWCFPEMTLWDHIPKLCQGLPKLRSLPSLPDFHGALAMDPPTQ